MVEILPFLLFCFPVLQDNKTKQKHTHKAAVLRNYCLIQGLYSQVRSILLCLLKIVLVKKGSRQGRQHQGLGNFPALFLHLFVQNGCMFLACGLGRTQVQNVNQVTLGK